MAQPRTLLPETEHKPVLQDLVGMKIIEVITYLPGEIKSIKLLDATEQVHEITIVQIDSSYFSVKLDDEEVTYITIDES